MDLLDGDVELTEFEAIDVQSIKGVRQGANGFPILMMKGLAAVAPVVKGARDCTKCDKTYDADHKGGKCENCGADLPDADTSKAADDKVKCPTCKGDGKIMGNNRDCPDCDASGKVTPAKAKQITAKSVLGIAVKAVTDGKIDQAPDISLGHQIMDLLAQAIQNEAAEIGAGSYGETCDVDLLNCAASMISRWVGREASPGDDGSMATLMCSAAVKAALSAKDINDLPDSAFAYIEDGGEKDSEGKTTPRDKRHFAIHDKTHADNAASRIAQGAKFGDQAKAKVTAAQKKFGEDTSKSRIAEEGTTVDTVTQGTGSLLKAVEDAVTKATAPLKERLEALGGELAKVKATPVPGGPVLSRNVQVKQPDGVVREDWAAKAAYFRDMAEQVTDRVTADGYRKLAREADAKAAPPAS